MQILDGQVTLANRTKIMIVFGTRCVIIFLNDALRIRVRNAFPMLFTMTRFSCWTIRMPGYGTDLGTEVKRWNGMRHQDTGKH